MRNFLAFIGLLLVVFVGVGFYKDWFKFSVDSDKNVTINMNSGKIAKDSKEIGEAGLEKGKDFLDNLKKDKDGSTVSTPTPASTAGPSGK